MSIICKFVLSRSSTSYYSGEEIAGLLKIGCLKECQLEAILLEFSGNSTVQWWELDKSMENIMHNDVSAHEVANKIFCSQQQKHVWQQLKLDISSCKHLQPHVEYTLKFSFQIPQQAPATYNCFYGRTEYGLRLQVQRMKKVNKEFHHRVIIKNKLDLTQGITSKKACAIHRFNDFGQITLQLPCTGFAPGQKILYHAKYQATQVDCKLLIQFNCYTTCRLLSNSNRFKQIKQIFNYKQHLPTETLSSVRIPLHCHTSRLNDPELIIKTVYLLEALLVNDDKKVLLRASIPLTIGTTPCLEFDGDLESCMCFINKGLTLVDSNQTLNIQELLDGCAPSSTKASESLEMSNVRSQTHIRKSFSQYYRKLKRIV